MLLPSMFFYQKHWERFHQKLHRDDGGKCEGRRLPIRVLWDNEALSELIEGAWRIMMRDIMPPDVWVEFEAFTKYWTLRRRTFLEPGGFLITTSGKRRELFTSTGKPRQLPDRPSTRQYDECLNVSYAKLQRLMHPKRQFGWLGRMVSNLLYDLGILTHYHREKRGLMPEQVAVLALSGAITGYIGGHKEIAWRKSRTVKDGRDTGHRGYANLKIEDRPRGVPISLERYTLLKERRSQVLLGR